MNMLTQGPGHNRRGWWWSLAILCVGYVAGSAGGPSAAYTADVRKVPPRQAFQSGGERSETVLREIAATLKQMDERLEHIEKAVAASAKSNGRN